MKLICTSAAADKLEQPLLLLPNTRVRIPITSIIFLPLSIMRLFNNATTRGVGWVRWVQIQRFLNPFKNGSKKDRLRHHKVSLKLVYWDILTGSVIIWHMGVTATLSSQVGEERERWGGGAQCGVSRVASQRFFESSHLHPHTQKLFKSDTYNYLNYYAHDHEIRRRYSTPTHEATRCQRV